MNRMPLLRLSIILLLCFILVPSPLSASPTFEPSALDCDAANIVCVEDDLTSDETWMAANVYVLQQDITVASGAILTIEAGTVVKARFRKLTVEGNLVAEGTAESPIIFTSLYDDLAGGDTNDDGDNTTPQSGNWENLQFLAGSSGTLAHVTFRYFGSDGQKKGAVYSETAELTLNQITFTSGRDLSPPISVDAGNVTTISGLIIDDMLYKGVEVRGGQIVGDVVWPNQNVIYYLLDDVTVAAGAKLTVEPGVIVKARAAALIVNGQLTINATADAMTTFTSYRDDGVGGDSNSDGLQSSPRTDWNGIQFMSGSQGNLNYAQVHHASGGSKGGGIYADGAKLAIQNCILTQNRKGLVASAAQPLPTINNCDIYENRTAGMDNEGTIILDATNNWWGSPAGPDDRSDADGVSNESPNGQDVSNYVDYSPWQSNKIHPEIVLSQNELFFNATAGGNSPDTPAIDVTTNGSGNLNWSAEASEPWLSIETATSVADELSIDVDTTGLLPGDYSGVVAVRWGPGELPRFEYVDVTLRVVAPEDAAPGLSISPTKLTFFGREGLAAPAPLRLSIANTGTGTLDWSASTDLPWLTLGQNNGTADADVEIKPNVEGLAEGTYNGQILIESPNASNGPIVVETELTLGCNAPQPLDAMLVFDRSGSMASSSKIGKAKEAATGFITLLDLTQEQVGLVSFDDESTLDRQLGQDGEAVTQAIQMLDAGGGTDITEALALAQEEALSARGRQGNLPLIVLLSDGTDGKEQEAISQAFKAKASGIYIVAIGLGDANEEVLTAIASYPEDYYYAPEAAELATLYNQVAVTVGCNVTGTGVLQTYLPLIRNSDAP